MALQYTVENLDDVPEAIRGEYVEKDGKFVLGVEGIKDGSGLETALAAERKRARELEAKVKKWDKLGKSDAEIAEMLAAAEEAERKKAEDEGNFDKILGQHRDKWAKERADIEAELNAARASERSAIIGTSVMASLTKAGATEEGVDLLPERLSARIKFETEDGKRVLKIMQADGETPMAGSGKDGLATFDDLAKEALTKWPSLFKGSGSGGSGAVPGRPGAKGGKTLTRTEFDGLSPKDRTAKLRDGFTVAD